MDLKEQYERGLALRKELTGPEAVEARMKALGDFGKPLQTIINAYNYGDVWSRTTVPMKYKSLSMVAMMAAANRSTELKIHLTGAVRSGCSEEELQDILLLVAMYCGLPAANEAHRLAVDVLAEARRS